MPKQTKIQLLESQLARALADYSNLEKRYAKDSGSLIRFATSQLLTKLLDIRDHLEATSKHFADPSIKMILDQLEKILSDEGIRPVDTSGAFDPLTMECAETVSGEPDQVVAVQRTGYLLHDRLLRPARVTVGQSNNK